jgi:hypothetical protein
LVVAVRAARAAAAGSTAGGDVVRCFEAVGATKPVELDTASTILLTDLIAGRVDEVGPDELPLGIFALCDALVGGGERYVTHIGQKNRGGSARTADHALRAPSSPHKS